PSHCGKVQPLRQVKSGARDSSRKTMDTPTHHHGHDDGQKAELRDPVCGMIVRADTPHRLSRDGEEVLFCSAGCKAKFEAAPEKYIKAEASGSCCSTAKPAAAAETACHSHGVHAHGAAHKVSSEVP